MSRPWSQDEVNQFIANQNRVLFIVVVILLIFGTLLVVGVFDDDDARRDSQGVPCSISTAQNADGTPECGNGGAR